VLNGCPAPFILTMIVLTINIVVAAVGNHQPPGIVVLPTGRNNWAFPAGLESVSICALGLRVSCWEALVNRSDGREILTATAMGLVIGILLSWGTVYGINRYLGPSDDPYETTGSARPLHPPD
jgi:hypothetical protein